MAVDGVRIDRQRITEFTDTFNAYRKEPPTTRSRYSLDGHEVVLVSGYLNEIAPTYFKDMVDVLIDDFGLPADRIHVVHTDSTRGEKANVEKLIRKYNSLRKKSPGRKILIVGHSRGGQLVLNALAQSPERIRDPALERLVLIQSPLKGTPTAEVAVNALAVVEGMLKKLKMLNSAPGCPIENISTFDAAAKSMRVQVARNSTLSIIDRLSPEDLKRLSQKVFYVTSHSNTQWTKLGTYVIDGASDGTVPLESQYVASFGRQLANLDEIGHTDLVLSDWRSGLSTSDRRAFVRTLFEMLRSPMLTLEGNI